MWWISCPSTLRSGRERSSTSASPPIRKISLPLPASAGPPLTGASRQSTLFVLAALATSRQLSGSVVLTSMKIIPARAPVMAPSAAS
jgi:hypothetical protein